MLLLVRDYFSVNRQRIFRLFLIPYGLFLFFQVVSIPGMYPDYDAQKIIAVGFVSAIYLAIPIGLFVGGLVVFNAIKKGTDLARHANMPLSHYLKSQEYRVRGRDALKRTDKDGGFL